jgi:hypothetical protein
VTEVKRGGPDYNQENFENADDYDGFLAEKMLNDQQFEELEQVAIPEKFKSGDSFTGFEDAKEDFQSFDEN